MFVSITNKEQIKKLYDFLFVQQLDFEACFPDDGTKECDNENPLMNGKQEICAASDVKIGVWDGMDNAIRVTGKLTEEVKTVFYQSLLGRGIWKYSFFRNGKEIVTVEDFDDVLLNLDKNEIEILRMIKVIE